VRILVTGADQGLGGAAAAHLARAHEVRAVARSEGDWRKPEVAAGLVEGVEAVVHLAEFDAPACDGAEAEHERLLEATLGTYTLCLTARDAGVGRVVMASRLSVFDAYPANYVIDEQWAPRPAATAWELAPYLAELSAREFAREGPLCGVCLRFAPIGQDPARQTREADALAAIEAALSVRFEPGGYRWHVCHVASAGRFLEREARVWLGLERKEGW
jgi:nucleoside-diphosphate-sugar epimerase